MVPFEHGREKPIQIEVPVGFAIVQNVQRKLFDAGQPLQMPFSFETEVIQNLHDVFFGGGHVHAINAIFAYLGELIELLVVVHGVGIVHDAISD